MRKNLQIVAIGALLALQAPSAGAETMYGLISNNKMVVMNDLENPGNIKGPYTVAGLGTDEVLLAIDCNPGNGAIYGLGYRKDHSQAQLYLINTSGNTYNATAVGKTINIALGSNANSIGFDFDAATSYGIRITGSDGNSILVNSSNGSVISAGPVSYSPGDIYNGTNISIAALAHTNSFFGSDNTKLYGYDVNTGSFILFNTSGQTAQTIGASGISADANYGIGMEGYYDVATRSNTVYFSATPAAAAGSSLYSIDLMTGLATSLGTIGTGNEDIKDITIKTDVDIPATVEGNMVVALTANHRNLVIFDSEKPGIVRKAVWIHGVSAGQTMMAIDFRPADMTMYGLGYNPANSEYQLYYVDVVTGSAIAINKTPVALSLGDNNTVITGFDFDPVSDFVRVTGNNGLNVRINPKDGQIMTTDKPYAYAEADAFFGASSSIGAIAYTNSYSGTNTAELYGIDYTTGALVSFNKASSGVINTVLNMKTIIGIGEYANGYMDIYYDETEKQNLGYLSSNIYFNGEPYSQLYTLNPATGETRYVGMMGAGIAIRDIAVQPKYAGLSVEAVAGDINNGLYLYPNPAVNQASVVLPTVSTKPVHAYITDMQGSVVNHFVYAPGGNQIDIDITALHSGIYSIRVHEEGSDVRIARLLKQ